MSFPRSIATTRSATGVPTGRLGVWWVIASEVVIFGGLIGSYLMHRLGHPEWVHQSIHTNTWAGAFNTLVLLTSSLFAVLAHQAIVQPLCRDRLRAVVDQRQLDAPPEQAARRVDLFLPQQQCLAVAGREIGELACLRHRGAHDHGARLRLRRRARGRKRQDQRQQRRAQIVHRLPSIRIVQAPAPK